METKANLNSTAPEKDSVEGRSIISTFKDRIYLTSFLVSLAFLGLTFLVFRPHFQFNDDTFVLLLLKGVGMVGAPTALNQRENIFLCWVLKELYIFLPSIQWYSWFLVATQFLSFWALMAAFQMGSQRSFKFVLFLFVSAVLFMYFFANLQWTNTSSLASIGAFFLLASLWREDGKRFGIAPYLLAFVLIVFSIELRSSSFFLIAVLSLPVLWDLAWKKKLTPARVRILGFTFGTLVLSLSMVAFDYHYYHQDPGWVKSIDFFNQHFELHETRNPVYNEQTKAVFDSVGWTANDLAMFQNWYFLDEDIYSVEHLKKLCEYFPKWGVDKTSSDSPLSEKLSNLNTQLALYSFIAILFLIPWRSFRFMLVNAFWMFAVMYVLMVYEKLPERVYLPALLFLALLAVFYAVPKWDNPAAGTAQKKGYLNIAVVLALVLAGFNVFFLQREITKNQKWNQYEHLLNNEMDQFHPQDDQLYVIWDSAFPYELMGAFDDYECFRHFNVAVLTWFQRSPTTRAMLNRFGVNHLFRDLVDNPKVFLICSPWELNAYRTCMMEKYQMPIDPEPAVSGNFFTAYRIHSVSTGSR